MGKDREIEKERPRVQSSRNKYEGSIWRDEASFGNLFRDHRARFRHDLITIKEIGNIVTVPPPRKKRTNQIMPSPKPVLF